MDHNGTKFESNKQHKAFVMDFLNPQCKKKKYIMGMSKDGYALGVSKLVDIDGFVDDFSSAESFANKPIFKSEQLSKDSMILVCSTVRTVTAMKGLKAKSFENILDYPRFFLHADRADLRLRIFDSFAKEFAINQKKFEWASKLMCDEKSREIFNTLVNYRITADIDLMAGFSYIPNEQYFPDFLKLSQDVFVDAGGYDGQTSLQFIKHCPNYKAVYLFEPASANLDIAKNNLSGNSNINFINKGLSNEPAELGFISGDGSASKISPLGDIKICVDTLDRLVTEEITFIKMDIEGGEAFAIEGARQHILKSHPKLAIAVYHKPEDFWAIPEQILSIRNDYDVHMRHYTEGTDETVMYFLPRP